MLFELHAHTREHSPCRKVGAVDLVRAAIDKGLDGLVLTDHHYLWSMEEIQSLRSAAEAPVSFMLVAGQEVTTSDVGDVLVYGAPVTSRGSGLEKLHFISQLPERPSVRQLFQHLLPLNGNLVGKGQQLAKNLWADLGN